MGILHSCTAAVCPLSPYGLQDGNALWFMSWFWRRINCLCVNFLHYFLWSLCFLSYLFTSFFCFLTCLSTTSRIDPFRFQARGRRRRPNLAIVFVLILCCSIFCYECMFAFVVFCFCPRSTLLWLLLLTLISSVKVFAALAWAEANRLVWPLAGEAHSTSQWLRHKPDGRPRQEGVRYKYPTSCSLLLNFAFPARHAHIVHLTKQFSSRADALDR